MTDRPPDLVLVVVDDLGWRDLGCYGSTFYETPVVDALAAGGVRFTAAYATSPVCSPSRASLLTGQYPATVGMTQFLGGHAVGSLQDVPYLGHLPAHQYSLARALRDGGYRTWHVGKWHLGPTGPREHGFDVNVAGGEAGLPPSYTSPYGLPGLSDGPPGEYLTDRLTDEAIALVRGCDDRPFFLNMWHYAVHIPIEAPADLVEKYRRKALALGLDPADGEDGELMAPWHLRARRVRRRRIQSHPGYAAMLENLDANLGRLLAALAERGRDTLVVLTSDNGGLATAEGSPTSNAPLAEGKGWLADGGLRGPLVMSRPGRLPSGATVHAPVTGTDVYPTMLAAAGLPPRPEQHRDGRSLLPLLHGEATGRGPVFWHYPHYSNQGGRPAAAVLDGSLKLVHHFEDGRDELFDVAADPGEADDLCHRLPGQRARLRALLDDWQLSVGALVPRPNPAPVPEDLPDGSDDPWTARELAFQRALRRGASAPGS
ncbi:MAG: sulfatase [Kineosporiaceae bacterium]